MSKYHRIDTPNEGNMSEHLRVKEQIPGQGSINRASAYRVIEAWDCDPAGFIPVSLAKKLFESDAPTLVTPGITRPFVDLIGQVLQRTNEGAALDLSRRSACVALYLSCCVNR
jgi:hypothetical protein